MLLNHGFSHCFLLYPASAGALEEEQEREAETLSDKQKHQMKHRELFLSRQIETLPATHIRGKCTVTLLNETESLASYLTKEDTFFYTLVYDPTQKTLLADRGEIRVGGRFQAEVPGSPLSDGESDGRFLADLENMVYTPEHPLHDKEIDQYLIVAKYAPNKHLLDVVSMLIVFSSIFKGQSELLQER